MPTSSADSTTVAIIRRLAETGRFALISPQAASDLMAHQITSADISDAIVAWIDAGDRVKPTLLHSFGGRQGDPAYEMKPKINGAIWYIKVCIDDRDGPNEGLALLSSHPDH